MSAHRGSSRRIATQVLLGAFLAFSLLEASHVPFLSTTSWDPIGPSPIEMPGFSPGLSAGRIEAAAPHPVDPNVMYVGADAGGIWKTATWGRSSADGGPVWLPLTDDQPSLDFSGYHPLMVIPGIAGRDIVLGAVSGVGAGILKSTNGGLGWQHLGNAQLDGASISAIAAEANNLKTLYIAVRGGGPGGGVYKSLDGGNSWMNTTAAIHTGGVSDVVMDPSDPDVLYAGLVGNPVTAGVYKTVDGGTSWSVMSGLPSAFFLESTVRLEVARSSPDVLYATVFQNELAGDLLINHFRSSDAGATWSLLPTPGGSPEERSWHVLLGVDPLDADHVFVGRAYEIFESTDGGQTWSPFEKVHDDWVNIAFDALNNPVPTGDRDLYAYDPVSKSLDSREGNLQVTEFYTAAVDPNDPERVYGVAQDHFDAMKSDGSVQWAYMSPGGGEAGKVLVNPTSSDRLYVSHPLDPTNFVERSANGGQSWTTIYSTTDFDKEDYPFGYSTQNAFVMDPTNPSRLLLGTTKVLETTDAESGAPSWTDFSPVLSPSSSVADQYITALATSSDGQSVYAATADQHIWVKHPGMFWQQEDNGIFGQNAGNVRDFAIDPSNPFRAYAITSGPGGKAVWHLTQAGKVRAWVNISGGFPAKLRASTIFVEWQYGPPAIYVGTNRGVYHTTNFGQDWSKFGANLPNTIVSDLQYQASHDILTVGTYGRGTWQILLGASTLSGQVFWDHNGDGVKNGQEGGLPAVKVYLDFNNNATHDSFEKAVFTNAAGNYLFTNVAPGTYAVRQIPPSGFFQTTATWTDVFVNGSNLSGLDIGNRKKLVITAELVDKITAQLLRQLANTNQNAMEAQRYSPNAFGPGETRIQPRSSNPTGRRDARLATGEPYIFIGDLNDLPGRLPGQPIGAEGEFERREPPPPPPPR